jgi:hypothetical protein
MKPNDCTQYESCSAQFCPLDTDLKSRVWFADEPVCTCRAYGKERWIRKQRSIQRRRTKSWFGRPVKWQELVNASKERKLTNAQRAELKRRALQNFRQMNREIAGFFSGR